MRVFKTIPIIYVFILLTSFLPESSANLLKLVPKKRMDAGQVQAGIEGQYLRSAQNVGGGALDLSGTLQEINGTAFVQFGVTNEFTLFSAVQGRQNNLETSSLNLSSSGLSYGQLGLRYGNKKAPLRFLGDLSALLPLFNRTSGANWAQLNSASKLPLGTGVTEWNFQGTLEVPVYVTQSKEISLGMSAGYTARSQGFSNLLPYSGYIRYEEPRQYFIVAGAFGHTTVQKDQFTSQESDERARTVIANSQLYNAKNPRVVNARVGVGFYFSDNVFFTGGFESQIAGKNAAKASVFMAALAIDIGGETTGSDYRKSNRGFYQYDLKARIIQVHLRSKKFLINKGKSHGVEVGEYLDVFEPDPYGKTNGITIGRAKVLEAGPTRSKLILLEYYREQELKKGLLVRRPLR